MIRTRLAVTLLASTMIAPVSLSQPATTTVSAVAAAPSLYKSVKGPFTVKVLDEDWLDEARKRPLPVRLYIPSDPSGKESAKHPVIIFSHGWGASRTNYGYFCEHLASHGYIVISPSHPGSDTASIPFGQQEQGGECAKRLRDRLLQRGADRNDKPAEPKSDPKPDAAEDKAPKQERMMESLSDPENLRNRPLDISFIIDQLPLRPATKEAADTSRIGVAGHSFGAYTAMAVGGMTVELPTEKARSFRDPRVKAVLPMSPQGRGTMGIVPGAWDRFGAPVLFLTGTKDYGQGARSAAWRREAFDAIATSDHGLVVIDDATHFTFGAPKIDGPLINSLSTAFFDTYVREDAAAKAWLGGFFQGKPTGWTAEFKGAAGTP